MGRQLENSYRLENGQWHIPPEDIRRCLQDFSFFMGNYAQILNKNRLTVPFNLNIAQKKLFETLLPMVDPKTRLDRRRTVMVVKCRQAGISVGITAFINYICSFVQGLDHMNVAHVFPVGDTITGFYNKKTVPIVTGVHPDLMPTMERETLSSSISTYYRDTKGMLRDNYYELVSSNASSIRSSTVNIALFDEAAFYKKPEQLEDAILPAIPDYGFSLVAYLTTFEDKKSSFFANKLKTAVDNPDEFDIVFLPWYLVYPERKEGIDINTLKLTSYDNNVLIPELQKAGIPMENWGDCVDWYHKRKLITTNMAYEYPTTLEEVMNANEDICVFRRDSIDRQRDYQEEGTMYRLVTDVQTGKVSAVAVDEGETSFFKIFRTPVIGERYRITFDPIASNSDTSDFFVAHVFNLRNNEQVATFRARNLSVEDCADYLLCMAKLYNRAELCPESNLAESIYLLIWNQRYYNWYYQNDRMRSARQPGIRTTVSSKEDMINRVCLLIDNDNVIIHDKTTLDEMETFIKKTKTRSDGSQYTRMEAKGKQHDDSVAALWTYAGSLDEKGMMQRRGGSGCIFL